jgi:hypothetical protein
MITRKMFESGEFNKRNDKPKKANPVLVFLMKNKNSAFTIKEISKKLKKNIKTRQLRKNKLVIYKKPYIIAPSK